MPSRYPQPPKRFFIIDEQNWDEYRYVIPGDTCFYIWERMSRLWRPDGGQPDWERYPANHLISNFQIPVSCRTTKPSRFRHKKGAIDYAAAALGRLLNPKWRRLTTFVPVPPSKVKSDPDHDDRLLKLLRTVDPPLRDIRELVQLVRNVDSKRKGVTPTERFQNYSVDEDHATPEPSFITIVDDVLTTGSHFKAVQRVLTERFPEVPSCGVFLARAVRPYDDEN